MVMAPVPSNVIEFGAVGCLDFSCADEIVGRLLLDHGGMRYFVLHGVSTKAEDLIDFVLNSSQCIVMAGTHRPGELQGLSRIERNDAVVRSSHAHGAVRKHRRRRVQSDCSATRARRNYIGRQRSKRQAGVGGGIIL